MNRRLLGALCALASLCGTEAFAGVQVTPGLKISAEQRYDDGLLLGAPAGGVGQMMSKLSPQLSLDLKDPTLTTEAWYTPDLIFRYGSGNATVDHRGRLFVKKALSRTNGFRGEMQVWRVTDPTSLPRLGMARTVSPVAYGKGELSYWGMLSERWNTRAGYRLEAAKVLETGTSTGLVHSPFAELEYAFSRRFAAGTEYRFQYFQLGDETDYGHGIFGTLRYRLTEHTNLSARGGPVFFQRVHEHTGEHTHQGDQAVMPRVTMELARDGETFDAALVAGYDLVGASGFSSALWAQYAGALFGFRLTNAVNTYAAGSFFRNAEAPGVGFEFGPNPNSSQGYAMGLGVEWKFNRSMSLIGSADRIVQVGDPTTNLIRNIAAVRLQVTAF